MLNVTNDFLINVLQIKKKYLFNIYFNKFSVAKNTLFLNNVNPFNKFFKNRSYKSTSAVFKKYKNFSFKLKLNFSHIAEHLTHEAVSLLNSLYKTRKLMYFDFNKLNNEHYINYMFLNQTGNSYNNHVLDDILSKYGSFIKKYFNKKSHHVNLNNNIVNVNYLVKERLYTKLKYSRSPAYDIVSGGSAALLSAFLGFLISEKYGFELVDSGDFYYLFMYFVFLSFSFKPLVCTLNYSKTYISMFTVSELTNFFVNIVTTFLKSFLSKIAL